MNNNFTVQKLTKIMSDLESKETYYQQRIAQNPENATLELALSQIQLIKYDVRSLLEEHKYQRPLSNIMGVDEAGELWNLSSGYIKNLCSERKIVCKKVGKTWVIDKNQPNPSKSSD